MRKLFVVPLFLFVGFVACQSYGFVRCYKPLSKGYLAAQKFSPFSTMFWTSQVATLGVALSLPQNSDESQEMLLANSIGGVLWAVGTAAALIPPPCPPSKVAFEKENLLVSDIDPKVFKDERLFFYIFHAINTTTLLIDASHSSKEGKYAYIGGAFISPYVVDILNRYLFNPYKLSPYWSPKIETVHLVPLENQMILKFTAGF